MLVDERRRRILEEVRRRGAVSVTSLASQLGVSGMTIRRDLETLSAEGMLDKVHGGATLRRGASAEELDFELTSERHLQEKEAIAAAALPLVEPGMSIGISAGSTTWTFACHVAGVEDLTIVTNSLRVAEEFRRIDPGRPVVLTGGVRTPSDALVGPVADLALGTLHCDVVFLGVHGVDVAAELTTPNLAEAQTNRVLIASGASLVVLADHTKFGKVGLTTIAELTAVDTLVTDSFADPDALAHVREHVGDVRVAPAP